MDIWDQVADAVERHEQGAGKWLKLPNDGDRAIVAFLGDPHVSEVVFDGGRYVTATDEHRARGLKASPRVSINVVDVATGDVKVLEQGAGFFKDLARVREKYGLDSWAFEIARIGAAKDPRTTYSILPEAQLTPEQRDRFAALQLHDLDAHRALEGAPQHAAGTSSSKRAAPGAGTARGATAAAAAPKPAPTLDAASVAALTTALRDLPRDAVDRFLARFGVRRIRDVAAARATEARRFADELAHEHAGDDVDPFGD